MTSLRWQEVVHNVQFINLGLRFAHYAQLRAYGLKHKRCLFRSIPNNRGLRSDRNKNLSAVRSDRSKPRGFLLTIYFSLSARACIIRALAQPRMPRVPEGVLILTSPLPCEANRKAPRVASIATVPVLCLDHTQTCRAECSTPGPRSDCCCQKTANLPGLSCSHSRERRCRLIAYRRCCLTLRVLQSWPFRFWSGRLWRSNLSRRVTTVAPQKSNVDPMLPCSSS